MEATEHHATEIDLLRSEMAEMRRELAELRRHARPTELPKAPQLDSGRRGFLRLAGAAAAGAAAAAVVGGAEPAAAATGQPFLLGIANQATNPNETTSLVAPSSTTLDDQTFLVRNTTSGAIVPPPTHRIAVAAITGGNDDSNGFKTAVYGRTAGPTAAPNTGGGQGVFGSASGPDNTYTSSQIGVFGTAGPTGYGVVGLCDSGATAIGALGRADEGYGLVGSSITGVSILARDSGRIQQALRGSAGAPTLGTFNKGEMIRDSLGDAYICVTTGSPGTWQKLTAQHPDYASAGGSINLLPRPIRLVDTRGGAPITNGSARLTPGTALTVQITGTVVDGLAVPAGAKGILGNLTAVAPLANGFAVVWASGQPIPLASNINYSTVTGNPAIANYFISAISADGKLNVQCAAAATHILVDVFGFVY